MTKLEEFFINWRKTHGAEGQPDAEIWPWGYTPGFHNFEDLHGKEFRPTIESWRMQVSAERYCSDLSFHERVYYYDDKAAEFGVECWWEVADVMIKKKDGKIGLIIETDLYGGERIVWVDPDHTLFYGTWKGER